MLLKNSLKQNISKEKKKKNSKRHILSLLKMQMIGGASLILNNKKKQLKTPKQNMATIGPTKGPQNTADTLGLFVPKNQLS